MEKCDGTQRRGPRAAGAPAAGAWAGAEGLKNSFLGQNQPFCNQSRSRGQKKKKSCRFQLFPAAVEATSLHVTVPPAATSQGLPSAQP